MSKKKEIYKDYTQNKLLDRYGWDAKKSAGLSCFVGWLCEEGALEKGGYRLSEGCRRKSWHYRTKDAKKLEELLESLKVPLLETGGEEWDEAEDLELEASEPPVEVTSKKGAKAKATKKSRVVKPLQEVNEGSMEA